MSMVMGPADTRMGLPRIGEPPMGAQDWPSLPHRIAYLLALAATFFVYLPAMGYQFVYDDVYQIVFNPHIHSWRYLPVYFTQSVWSQLPNSDTNLYRPLFLLWLRLNQVLFGEQPAAWHLTTLAMHIIATALVYLLARRLLRSQTAALLGAAIFGLHPVHVEAVAWVSAVPEPLGAALFIGALLCYLRQRERGKHAAIWLALSLLLFAAGMLVKETVAVLPVVIAAYELTMGRQDREAGEPGGTSLLPWRGMPAYVAVLALYLGGRRLAMGPLHPGEVPLAVSLISWPWLLWTYLRMLVWPAWLSPSYDFPYVQHVLDTRFLLPLVMVLGGAAALGLWYRSRRARWAIFLVSWFLITLAPAFVAFCLAYADESYHDRYLYLPSVGFALLAGSLLAKLCESRPLLRRTIGWGLAAAILLVLGLAAHRQLRYWESNYQLFQRASTVAPHNERAAINFGAELIKRRQYARAVELCGREISYHPNSERLAENAGFASLALGDYAAAENYYAKAAQLRPEEGKLFYFLGIARLRQKQYEAAAEALRAAINRSPTEPFYHYTLGTVLEDLGQWREARDQFLAEMRLNQKASQELARTAWLEANNKLDRRTLP